MRRICRSNQAVEFQLVTTEVLMSCYMENPLNCEFGFIYVPLSLYTQQNLLRIEMQINVTDLV